MRNFILLILLGVAIWLNLDRIKSFTQEIADRTPSDERILTLLRSQEDEILSPLSETPIAVSITDIEKTKKLSITFGEQNPAQSLNASASQNACNLLASALKERQSFQERLAAPQPTPTPGP